MFFLLKIPVRPEGHLPFLNSQVGFGEGKGDTPILRGETPKSKTNRKPHKHTLYKDFICVGSRTRVRSLGGAEPHFLVSILQTAHWMIPRMRGSQSQCHVHLCKHRATSSTCTPSTYPHQWACLWWIYTTHWDGIHSAEAERLPLGSECFLVSVMGRFYFRWPRHQSHCGHLPVDGGPLEGRYHILLMLVTLPLGVQQSLNKCHITELKSACHLFCIFQMISMRAFVLLNHSFLHSLIHSTMSNSCVRHCARDKSRKWCPERTENSVINAVSGSLYKGQDKQGSRLVLSYALAGMGKACLPEEIAFLLGLEDEQEVHRQRKGRRAASWIWTAWTEKRGQDRYLSSWCLGLVFSSGER